MCGSMADIQSATAEIRQGKKIEEEETTGQKYNGLPYATVELENFSFPYVNVHCLYGRPA